MNGSLTRKIGNENDDITRVYGYDEPTGDVYYQAAAVSPHDRQVFVSHKKGKVEQLTNEMAGTRQSSRATINTSSTHGATITRLMYAQSATMTGRFSQHL